MERLNFNHNKNNKGYYDFRCLDCGSIVVRRSDVGAKAKNCGCRVKKKYKSIYDEVMSFMKRGVDYSSAVKMTKHTSTEVSKAFNLNGGKIHSLDEFNIEVRKGKLYDKRHNIPINGMHINNMGYYVFRLKGESLLVHRFIANKFLNKGKSKTQVNHKNGIKTDNRVENLEWVTPLENINHAFDNDLNHCGERALSSKLKDEEVKFILQSNMRNCDISRKLNISQQRVCDIKKGRFSKRLKDKLNG